MAGISVINLHNREEKCIGQWAVMWGLSDQFLHASSRLNWKEKHYRSDQDSLLWNLNSALLIHAIVVFWYNHLARPACTCSWHKKLLLNKERITISFVFFFTLPYPYPYWHTNHFSSFTLPFILLISSTPMNLTPLLGLHAYFLPRIPKPM